MENLILTLLIVICVCTIIVTIIDIVKTIKNYIELRKHLKSEDESSNSQSSDLRDVDILMKPDSISNIDKVLDQCIHDAGDIYNILVLAPAQLSNGDSQYINEKEQKRMTEYIVQTIYTRMSDSMKKLLSLSYKIDDDKSLDDLIRLRVNLYMINFVTSYNELK